MTRHLFFALFIVVALLVVAAVHYYLWLRLVRDAQIPAPWRQIGTWAVILLGASLPVGMALGRAVPFPVSRWLSLLPYIWMGAMVLVFFLLLGADLLRLVAAGAARLTGSGDFPADPSRRLALSRFVAGAVGLVATGLSGIAVARAMGEVEVRRVEVVLSRLPRALDGFRIVQLTDLHIGLTLGREFVERVVERTRGLRPDLVAITGDLVDGTPDQLRDEVAPLAALDAPHGVFFVTGNHEYYSGAPEWLPELERLGMRVLRNGRVDIERGGASFDLAGIDDHNAHGMAPGHGPDLGKALAGRDPEAEVVLLAHQPRAVEEAAALDVGLVLAGHTHGGQLWPWNLLVRLQQPYVKGLHRHGDGRTQIYVSQGTGFWGPPMRLGTTGEITEIILRADG
jgi:predicted MPP superfamily phosphohydrolase